MVVRPSPTLHALTTVMAVGVPLGARNGHSLWAAAVAHGAGSRQVLAILAYWAVVAVWGVLAAVRARTTVRAGPDEPPQVVVQGAFRRRTVDLAGVRQVRLVTLARGTSTRRLAVLLDATGRVVATPAAHRGVWTRDDAVTLLLSAGVAVDYEHRLSGAAEVEAAYPGSTTWADRHPRALTVLVLMAIGVAVPAGVWFFGLA